MYRFFAQPQVDQLNHHIFGYEALLRKQKDDAWVLPDSFTEISVADQAQLLQRTATALNVSATNQRLAFNLNNQQFRAPQTLDVILALKAQLGTINLSIELTEAPTLAEVTHFSQVLHQHGIKLVIDDVGTGSNTYPNVAAFLPFVDEIKFAMQNFRSAGTPDQIPAALAFWTKIAQTYHLVMILEGVENAADQILAKHYGIRLHQGYLYGKPALV
ncbi:EAL domain-containing protein [Levilactobacillus acidifarinae]|uniref:C-di-GMP-specific phosphodiesterase n=1 Tax=Levilactobacillus acidifarinae DSM 19394 = JCM 15949 TaxID=1423715 RepID=A0A0R1LL01_9LACO|nr:EAL domain-containing protein [Levilactobacillus acidifarinae]KRK96501.1 C-di-GMP-specific phosphodiesterase [Levilactobacillus acidifarinae DSM 19394]GEO68913.1 diguanylate cyclase [Levilactobacillus acidifarinae]